MQIPNFLNRLVVWPKVQTACSLLSADSSDDRFELQNPADGPSLNLKGILRGALPADISLPTSSTQMLKMTTDAVVGGLTGWGSLFGAGDAQHAGFRAGMAGR